MFLQDGAPSHYSVAVRAWLDNHLNGRWIGRRGAIEWPARSPDITPCDYWLWAYIRQQVYPTAGFLYANINALGRRIEEKLQNIPMDMVRKSMRNFEVRIRKLIEVNGHHFEL